MFESPQIYKIWDQETDILEKSQAYLHLYMGTNKVKYVTENQGMIYLSARI